MSHISRSLKCICFILHYETITIFFFTTKLVPQNLGGRSVTRPDNALMALKFKWVITGCLLNNLNLHILLQLRIGRVLGCIPPYHLQWKRECSRLKSSMHFKRDLSLENIPFPKQPFKTQPQIENEDITWSPQFNLHVKRINKRRAWSLQEMKLDDWFLILHVVLETCTI